MNPVSFIVRRRDGLRRLECRFLTRKMGNGVKERVAESRFVRLTPEQGPRPGHKSEMMLMEVWESLGEATRSRRTMVALALTCSLSTAAPIRCREPVPVLSKTPVDLRPWLCDPDAICALLLQLRPFAPRSAWASLLYDPDDETRVNDPWFVFSPRERVPLSAAGLNPLTWERVAGLVKGVSHQELQEIERAYLAWDGSPDLAEMILALCRGKSGAHWLTLFGTLPREVQRLEVERWKNTLPKPCECPRELILLAKPAWRLDPKGGKGLAYLWEGIKTKIPSNQLIDGVILWNNFSWRSAPAMDAEGRVDTSLLCRLTNSLLSPKNRNRIAAHTWEALLERPALQPAFERVLESRADPKVKAWMFRLLREARHDTRDDELDALVCTHYDTIEAAITTISNEYRCKAVSFFEAVYWCRSTKMPIPRLLQVISNLCRSPLTTADHGHWVWRAILRSWGVEDLPTSSWRRIDDAWRSHNHADAINNGLDRLDSETMHPILRTGLRLRVRLAMEVVRLAGRTMEPLVARALARLREHPVLEINFDAAWGIETARYLLGDSKDLTRWGKHQSGENRLRPEAAIALRDKLEGRRCERLLGFLRDELIEKTTVAGTLDPHTRLYAQAAEENRRAYRKLVRRYCNDGEAGVLFHPRNQLWLRQHSFVKSGIWLGGIQARVRLEDGTEVLLELERRFEQVLKMGSLVNSCLALDGCNSHSALANAADINKQVVMAYDSNGQFLARQLVGIAEEQRLVCFDVYSRNDQRLEPAFSAFDHQLGRILSLPLHREGEYELKPIVCRQWYDDHAWNPAEATQATILDLAWGGSRSPATALKAS